MNGAPQSSLPSGNKFGQHMVDQRPKFDRRKTFRRKLRRGRPANNAPREHWLK